MSTETSRSQDLPARDSGECQRGVGVPGYFLFFAFASRPKYFSQARAKGLATKIEE